MRSRFFNGNSAVECGTRSGSKRRTGPRFNEAEI
jgi:hypothetical protein